MTQLHVPLSRASPLLHLPSDIITSSVVLQAFLLFVSCKQCIGALFSGINEDCYSCYFVL